MGLGRLQGRFDSSHPDQQREIIMKVISSFAAIWGLFWYCFDDWLAVMLGSALVGSVPAGLYSIFLITYVLVGIGKIAEAMSKNKSK